MSGYKILLFVGVGVIALLGIVVRLPLRTAAESCCKRPVTRMVDPYELRDMPMHYECGDIQELGTLDPGEKIIISPPPENEMEFVQVTADEGILVNKAYRTPTKMPGMMGS